MPFAEQRELCLSTRSDDTLIQLESFSDELQGCHNIAHLILKTLTNGLTIWMSVSVHKCRLLHRNLHELSALFTELSQPLFVHWHGLLLGFESDVGLDV